MNEQGLIYIIGDSHVGLTEGDERQIVAWIDRLRSRKPKALYLNGDVFHYFIGHKNFLTSSVEKFLEKLRELRDEGTAVVYVEGNRDFFVRGSLAAAYVSEVVDHSSFRAGERTFYVVHGDMINDRDLPYRFWRRFSKNRLMKIAVGLVPRKVARRLVDRVEQRLARANFKHKRRLPVELMAEYGARRASEGFDTVILGHFHHKLSLPAGTATVEVLPPWYESGEALAISPMTGAHSYVVV